MKRNGDTKAAMANALRACMRESSIDRISIKTITDACNLNRQTFYYHFKDIYDLAKWMYIHDISEAVDVTLMRESWEDSLRILLREFDKNRECHLAIYNSRNYYPNLRHEMINSLVERFEPVFAESFDRLGYDDVYRDFLLREYSLTLFEFIERRARGNAYSTDEGFIDNWTRTIRDQFYGAGLRDA